MRRRIHAWLLAGGLGVCLVAGPAHAGFTRYVDEEGVVHVVDSKDKVPARYRDRPSPARSPAAPEGDTEARGPAGDPGRAANERLAALDLDPAAIARSEAAMWKAYYGGDARTVGRELIRIQTEQFGLSREDAFAVAEPMARAALKFLLIRSGYERSVLPAIRQSYQALADRVGAGWDVDAAARAELGWWVARRTPGENDEETVGSRIADLYAILYGERNEHLERAGLLRARAARRRDLEAGTRAGVDWAAVEATLVESYAELLAGIGPGS